MAPGKPVGVIKVQVPRHNAQRIGAKLTAEVEAQADSAGIRTDVGQSSHEMTQAIESASEWNSLLLTARAGRGPQWDVGTQQFHVEEYSDLYYDPTLIREAAQKQFEEENGPSKEQQERQTMAQRDSSFQLSNPHIPPNRHPVPMGGGPPSVNYPYPNSPSVMRGPGPGQSFPPAMPPNQYGRHDGSPARMPMHMGGGMGGIGGGMGGGGMGGGGMGGGGMGGGMGGMGGGMPMGGMGNMGGGMGGNMANMGGNMDFGHQNPAMAMGGGGMGMPSPGVMAGRRMTRGMTDEYGMH